MLHLEAVDFHIEQISELLGEDENVGKEIDEVVEEYFEALKDEVNKRAPWGDD